MKNKKNKKHWGYVSKTLLQVSIASIYLHAFKRLNANRYPRDGSKIILKI
jgi:hypothetical protein